MPNTNRKSVSDLEKNIQIITGILVIIYLIVIIIDFFFIPDFASMTLIDVLSFAFFLVFLFGAICCMDYPLITEVTFVSWTILRFLSEKLPTGLLPTYGLVTYFFGLANFILGFVYLFLWWDKRDKFET